MPPGATTSPCGGVGESGPESERTGGPKFSAGMPSTGQSTRTTYGGDGSGSSGRPRQVTWPRPGGCRISCCGLEQHASKRAGGGRERKAGRKTAGVDGEVAMTGNSRARRLGHVKLWSASPTLRDNHTGGGLVLCPNLISG